ncbi:LytTR family DNA-binding domain-containing protein [Aurantiacibacter flavus]|uniref:LytTR family DNA-binding domain-containing protein n=1 Tax=Aurantiacibacter flavus TaxID=3145232 RepID=A0ABV0CZV2_9SPHN
MRDFANFYSQDVLAEIPRAAGVALLAGLGFTLIGPFGTDDWVMFARLGFWTAMSAGWFAITFLFGGLLARFENVRRLEKRWRWALLFVASLVPAMAASALSLNILGRWSWTGGELFDLVWHSALIGLMLEGMAAALFHRADHRPVRETARPNRRQADEKRSGSEPTEYPPLMKRLPPEARGPITCLQMEDHYVRVHTGESSTLVLMRFSEALSEIGEGEGLRVHRSWWVASDAIQSVERRGRTARIKLSNALEVPVSQPYVEAVTALHKERRGISAGT